MERDQKKTWIATSFIGGSIFKKHLLFIKILKFSFSFNFTVFLLQFCGNLFTRIYKVETELHWIPRWWPPFLMGGISSLHECLLLLFLSFPGNYFHKIVLSLVKFIFPGNTDKYQGRYHEAWKLIQPSMEHIVSCDGLHRSTYLHSVSRQGLYALFMAAASYWRYCKIP